MTVQTYALLKTDTAAALARDDLTARIAEFVANAEFRIARELRPRGFEVYTTSTFTSGSAGAIIDQPTRLIDLISFHVLADAAGTATGSIRYPCFERPYSFIRAYTPNQSTTGRPKFYADMGANQIIVAPSPSAAFTFELAYYERLAPLSDSNTTNYLTANAPQLLLYATLLESAPYLRDDARIETWQGLYDRHAAAFAKREQSFNVDDQTDQSAAGGA